MRVALRRGGAGHRRIAADERTADGSQAVCRLECRQLWRRGRSQTPHRNRKHRRGRARFGRGSSHRRRPGELRLALHSGRIGILGLDSSELRDISMPLLMQPLAPDDLADWPAVLDGRGNMLPEPAIYALLLNREIGRLCGTSRLLYVGSTGELGGTSDTCRLRIYRYPNAEHAMRLRSKVQRVLDTDSRVTFVWRYTNSKNTARDQESSVLASYLDAHWELPPFNHRL
jgi:hypothetical protein